MKLTLGEIRDSLLHASGINGIGYEPTSAAASSAGYPGATLGDMYDDANAQATQYGLSHMVQIDGDFEDYDDPELRIKLFYINPQLFFWWARRKDYDA